MFKKMLPIILFSGILLGGSVFGQDWQYGFGLNVGTRGYGLSSNITRSFGNRIRSSAKISIMDIVAEDELRGTDYYGRPVVFNDPRMITIPVMILFTYFPFFGQIENNFSPFVRLGGGIQYVMDGDDGNASFSDNISNAKKYAIPGLQFGGGFEFFMSPTMDINIFAGYEIMPLDDENPEGMKNLNGLMINLDFMFEF